MEILKVADPATTSGETIVGSFFPTITGVSVDPASIAIVGGASSIGFYDGSLTALGIGSGLLITSGTMPGFTNTVGWYGQDNGMTGDPALDAVVNTVFSTVSYDATTITFDFTVTDPQVTGISFKVVFGTDEYPEWVDQFVDIAVVMINGVNVAYFNNDPMAPLSVVSSNLAAGYFIDNGDGHLPIEYDGISNVLTVYAPVHQGTNTLTIGIADTGDHIYDSGLFISGFAATNLPIGGVSQDVPCTEGADDLIGTSASESFDAKGGDDSIDAAGGDDVILGGAGLDVLMGGAGKDFLDGGSDHDVLDGGDDDDQIQFSGDDAIDGGAGLDTLLINVSALAAPVTLDISNPAAIQTLTDGSTIQGIEVLKFTGGDEIDVVTGGAGADVIATGGGDDVLTGGDGDDSLDGGAGEDVAVFAGASTDYQIGALISGGYLVTNLATGAADSLTDIEQLAFDDGLFAPPALILTGAEIWGTADDDRIGDALAPAGQPFTTPLADLIHAGDGNDQVWSGGGDDIVFGEAGDDEIWAGAGTDTAVFSGAYADYLIAPSGDGWHVTDLRAGSPDGYNQLVSVERLQFSDMTIEVGLGAPPEIGAASTGAAFIEPEIGAGTQSFVGALSYIDADHDDTHTVEILSSSGVIAGVGLALDPLVEPNDTTPGAVAWTFTVDNAAIQSLSEGQVRTVSYVLRINDSGGNHVDQPLTFTITGTNDVPVVSGPINVAAVEGGAAVTIDALAGVSDGDNGAKLIVVGMPAALPSGLSYNTMTHQLTLDPTDPAFAGLMDGDAQVLDVFYDVSDGFSTVSQSASFTVHGVGQANHAPTLASPLADVAGKQGQAMSYAVPASAFADADLDVLTLSASLVGGGALPSWLTFDPATGAFSGTPVDVASYSIQVTATDPSGEAVSDVFVIDVASGGLNLTGTAGADSLTGSSYGDQIFGAAGADLLYGLGGDDVLDGGAGNDTLDGGAGNDTASYASAGAGVTVNLTSTAAQNTGGSGKDKLVGVENLTGSNFADTLTGSAAANRLSGGDGADALTGAGGADLLLGGAGADRFIYKAAGESTAAARDAILDFSHAEGDRIDLSAIDAISGGKKNEAFTLTDLFHNKAGELIATAETDGWVVQGDVNGDGVADFAILVLGTTPLTASDFVL